MLLQTEIMKKLAFVLVVLALLPFAVYCKTDGIVEFDIGKDSLDANEMSVVGGGEGRGRERSIAG